MNSAIARRTFLGAAASLIAAPGLAQGAWPNRPIRIVVAFPPSGFNDVLARTVADRLSSLVGQPGFVENRSGAGGAVATAAIARSEPDGYQILVGNTATLVFAPLINKNAGYDSRKDFTLLGTCARLANALVINPKVHPVTDVAGLLTQLRANPGSFNFASSGVGASPHLAAELFKAKTGVNLTHVPYRGFSPALTDLLAGTVGIMFDNITNILPHVGPGGGLRVLAVTGSSRDAALPNVPTMMEAGVAEYEMYIWFGFVGPAGLPQPVRQKLVEVIRTIVETPDIAERLRQLGTEAWMRKPDAMMADIVAEQEQWLPIIRDAGLSAD